MDKERSRKFIVSDYKCTTDSHPQTMLWLFLLFTLRVSAANRLYGGDRDEHGCIPSAGYTWSDALDRCVRSVEYQRHIALERAELFPTLYTHQCGCICPHDVCQVVFPCTESQASRARRLCGVYSKKDLHHKEKKKKSTKAAQKRKKSKRVYINERNP